MQLVDSWMGRAYTTLTVMTGISCCTAVHIGFEVYVPVPSTFGHHVLSRHRLDTYALVWIAYPSAVAPVVRHVTSTVGESV